jgi:hypothetical protein
MSGARLYFMLFAALAAAHNAPPKFETLPPASMQASPPPAPVMTPTPAPQSHEIMFAATAEAVPDAPSRIGVGVGHLGEKGRQRARLMDAIAPKS